MSTYIHKAFARTATVAAATGFATLAFAGTASAQVMDRPIGIGQCEQPQTQTCKQIPSVTVSTDGPLMVEFQANNNHCSDIVANILIDGREWGSNVVGPGQRDGGYFIPTSPGTHTIGVQAEGIKGGCNPGFLSAWGGTLHIETNQDAQNGRG
jgi:hypothetical protein